MAWKTNTYYKIVALFLVVINQSNYGYAANKNESLLGASFIFGDSLVDAGNNNYLSTLSRANMTPNGIDFKASGGNPTGRFTNGRTIADIVGNKSIHNLLHMCLYIYTYTRMKYISEFLGEKLGQPNYAVPFLAPNATGKAILHGVNYASGGGGIINATGSIFVSILYTSIHSLRCNKFLFHVVASCYAPKL